MLASPARRRSDTALQAEGSVTDIFISYSSKDRKAARALVALLEARGWRIWWDKKIPPGQAFDRAISQALDAAKCIIVLWSKTSVTSDWVLEEAHEGVDRRILLPARLDAAKLPFGFKRLQTVDLSRWQGSPSSPGVKQLAAAAAALVEPVRQTSPRAKPPAKKSTGPRHRKLTGALDGKTIVFTGALTESRNAQAEKIRVVGASTSNAVSGKTDYLVVGGKPGAVKLEAAKKHGVKQLSEQQWLNILNEAYARILVGKTIVFTGKLSQPRARLETVARRLGAKPVGAVSGRTNYLVVGEDAGSKKLAEAQKYDVEVIKEAIWNEIVATLKR